MVPNYVIEKKKQFSGEKFKQAAEICISSKESNINSQDHGEKFPGHVRDLHGSLSHHRLGSLGGKSGFIFQAQGPCGLYSLGTWCSVSQPLQLWLVGANVQLRL